MLVKLTSGVNFINIFRTNSISAAFCSYVLALGKKSYKKMRAFNVDEIDGSSLKNKLYFFQHYMNMHAKGGEVKCDECGKMVKNKWYMRRHKVTHHGAPLRKVKKSLKNSNDSDSEE